MDRKRFLAKLGLGAAAVVMAPLVFDSCEEKEDSVSPNGDNGSDGPTDFTIDLSDEANKDLTQEGGYIYKNDIIIANLGNSEYIALSKICTHQQCTVSYKQNQAELVCPCHGSVFDTDGQVLTGPATTPLKEYKTELNGQKLRIFE